MAREAIYHAVILKKQPFGDADEIITFFTLEAGKVRGLAKSVKLQKSKLQNVLQGLFYVRVVLAQGSGRGGAALRKIIRCEALETFMPLRENLEATKAGLFAAETVYKATPDEQKNPQMFRDLLEYLRVLSKFSGQRDSDGLIFTLHAKFQILLLENLGFGVRRPRSGPVSGGVYFSRAGGGFAEERETDSIVVEPKLYDFFCVLHLAGFDKVKPAEVPLSLKLSRILGDLLEYHLERKLHSRKLITG
ncbi:MAG: DNA repair protein RecO [Patescibacteria group bacterium]|nr:DNA repair protein RecO [Patescibacteria group bacterium]